MDWGLMQVLQGVLLLSIVILAFRTIEVTLDARTSNKFILKGIIQDGTEDNSINRVGFFERLLSLEKYKAHLAEELKDARMSITVNRFIMQRVLSAAAILILLTVLYFITKVDIYLYLSLPLAIGAYMLPKRSIGKNKKYYVYKMKMELPEYLSAFAILLQSFTPFEATKKSVDYAGPLLKPYVEHLITQIGLYPASQRPYEEFAEAVDLREAKEFVVALEQIMKVDAQAAHKIIQDQIEIMGELQEEAYNEQIETRPEEVENFINPMLFPFIGIIFTFLFVLIVDSMSGM